MRQKRKPIAIGTKFGRLTTLDHGIERRYSSGLLKRFILCRCECGNEKRICADKLDYRPTYSCGCIQKERMGALNRTHGLTKHPLFGTWVNMRERCNNPKLKCYKYYGGRGIKVSPAWETFDGFLKDVGERPSRHMTLGRIDNDGNYCKDNFRWETRTQQNNNTRRNRFVTLNGKKQTLRQWCSELGVSYGTALARLDRGWQTEDAFLTPIRPIKQRARV